MRVIVLGLGIQGRKRLAVAGPDAVGSVDPVAPTATWRDVRSQHARPDASDPCRGCLRSGTGTPADAICQADSLPASPPPTI